MPASGAYVDGREHFDVLQVSNGIAVCDIYPAGGGSGEEEGTEQK